MVVNCKNMSGANVKMMARFGSSLAVLGEEAVAK
jgi:hypothetical protein